MPLDDTITAGQAGHIADHEVIAAAVNDLTERRFSVATYGAVGDGTTDDTAEIQATIDAAVAAGGGVVYFPPGVYVVGGALQDTSNRNAQLLLPEIDYVDTEQITIVFEGALPPPPIVSVIGTTPIPDNHSVIKGTLNAGTGALLSGRKASGSLDNFTNVFFVARNLTFRMPANPVLSCLNLSKVAAVDLDNVIVDGGSYYVEGLTEPTTTTSFGIRCPANNNGAYVRLGAVNVVGFYKGYEFGEHANGEQVTAWGCKQAAVFVTATNHGSVFQRFMAVHCERGLVFTGYHPVDIIQYDIEHAATGWWVTDFDIDDASNFGVGAVVWHVVLAGVGPDDTFTVNGATNLRASQLGSPNSGTAADVSVDSTGLTNTDATDLQEAVADLDAAITSGPGGGAWGTYTPTLTQSGAVTKTVVRAAYVQVGRTVHVNVHLSVTGTGTGSNVITVTLPVAAVTGTETFTIGEGRVFDSSATLVYRGVAVAISSTTVRLEATNSTAPNGLGATGTPFTAALASGDIVEFSATYEAAA